MLSCMFFSFDWVSKTQKSDIKYSLSFGGYTPEILVKNVGVK